MNSPAKDYLKNEPLAKLQRFHKHTERLRHRFKLEQMAFWQRSHEERIDQLDKLLEVIQEQIDIKTLESEGGREWCA